MQSVKYEISIIREVLRILNDIAKDSKSYVEEPLYLITALGDVNKYLQAGTIEEVTDSTESKELTIDKDSTDNNKDQELVVGDV